MWFLPLADSLFTKPDLASFPAPQMVLDRFEDHPQPSSAQTTIGGQEPQVRANLIVIRPIAARTCLTREKSSTTSPHRVRSDVRSWTQLRNQLVVGLGRCAHEHPSHHPALDGLEGL